MSEDAKGELPGYWHFLWMFWMQPITLHRWLVEAGYDPELKLWSVVKNSQVFNPTAQGKMLDKLS